MLAFMKTLQDCSPIPSLTVTEVADRVRSAEARLFDCNPPREWMRGHIPGAVNLDPVAFHSAELPAAADALLVFYGADDSCGAAAYAARRAVAMGYTNVRVMRAGLAGWANDGLPVEHIRPRRPASRS